jgi:hypothetical protein
LYCCVKSTISGALRRLFDGRVDDDLGCSLVDRLLTPELDVDVDDDEPDDAGAYDMTGRGVNSQRKGPSHSRSLVKGGHCRDRPSWVGPMWASMRNDFGRQQQAITSVMKEIRNDTLC